MNFYEYLIARIKKTDKKTFYKAGVLISILLLAFVIYFVGSKKKIEETAEIAAPVVLTKPSFGRLQSNYKINGYIESESMVTIFPKVSGTLVKIYVDMNDNVYKGQLLAQIDPEIYALTLRQAEAQYLAVKSTFERVDALYLQNATSKQNYEEVRAKFDASKAQYEQAKLQLSYTDIVAPISGIILKKHDYINEGMLVSPQAQLPLFTIGNTNDLMVKAQLPEMNYSEFSGGKDSIQINVEIAAIKDQQFEGYIERISPYINPQSKTFEIKCRIRDTNEMLRPGMFITISFIMDDRSKIYYLPINTLTGDDVLWYIDVIDMKAKQLIYKPTFSNDDYFQLAREYKDYLFIIDGQNFLYEGQKLNVLNADEMKIVIKETKKNIKEKKRLFKKNVKKEKIKVTGDQK